MIKVDKAVAGKFCWLDLAARDADGAKGFYAGLFGWSTREQSANGGTFTRLQLAGEDVGSLYQLMPRHLADGMRSHWTPYVRVGDLDRAAQHATSLGGMVLVRPFAVSGIARIALIQDSVGAEIGLWEPIA
jgi:uncharacterized protein